jgi:hypothetical protein
MKTQAERQFNMLESVCIMVFFTVGNRCGYRGNRCYRRGAVTVPRGRNR